MAQVVVEAKGLLFDNDGVIVSSIASVNRCWRKWAAHYGVPNADQVQITHGTRAVEIMENLAPSVDKEEGLRLIEEMEIADVDDLEVLPGVRVLLESLPKERWAIVTSATWRLLIGRLKAAKLPLPDRIVSGDRVVNGKPHPEPYLRGAAMVGSGSGRVHCGGRCSDRRRCGEGGGLSRDGRVGDALGGGAACGGLRLGGEEPA